MMTTRSRLARPAATAAITAASTLFATTLLSAAAQAATLAATFASDDVTEVRNIRIYDGYSQATVQGPNSDTVIWNAFDTALGSLTSATLYLDSRITTSNLSYFSADGFINVGPVAGMSTSTGGTWTDSFALDLGEVSGAPGSTFQIYLTLAAESLIGSENEYYAGWIGNYRIEYTYEAAPQVPLPAALPLLGTALAGFGALSLRRRRG